VLPRSGFAEAFELGALVEPTRDSRFGQADALR